MDRVYVVFGQSGEWSDASEWAVRAFDNEADARAFVDVCTRAAAARPARPDRGETYEDYLRRRDDAQAREDHHSRIEAWCESIQLFVAMSPDDQMPHTADVEYGYYDVPFGHASTVHATAPPRLRPGRRQIELDEALDAGG